MGQRTGPEDDTFMAQFGSWIPLVVLGMALFAVIWLVGSCVG